MACLDSSPSFSQRLTHEVDNVVAVQALHGDGAVAVEVVLGQGVGGVVLAGTQDAGLGGAHLDALAATHAGQVVRASTVGAVERDGLHGAALHTGAALNALLGIVIEPVAVEVLPRGQAVERHALEAHEVAARAAMAQAHDVGVLRGDGLHHHAGLNGVLVDGDGLVLRDLLADALLDEVFGHLAQRQAGAARVLLGERHADALPHQAALAG